MPSILQRIVNEWNPAHDFDRTGYFSDTHFAPEEASPKEFWSGIGKTLAYRMYFIANGAKHLVRGGILGAGIGALTYASSRDEINGAALGAAIFGAVDFIQYVARGAIIPQIRRLQKSGEFR